MKRYWDGSALLDVLDNARLEKLSREKDQWTRPHTLTEMFSALTGGRLGFRFCPDDATAIIREITQDMNFVELNSRETFAALDEAQLRGVRGGNVHDWLHAAAARKAKVAVLLTYNLGDFKNFANGFSIEAP
jgi:hypothetical protein